MTNCLFKYASSLIGVDASIVTRAEARDRALWMKVSALGPDNAGMRLRTWGDGQSLRTWAEQWDFALTINCLLELDLLGLVAMHPGKLGRPVSTTNTVFLAWNKP